MSFKPCFTWLTTLATAGLLPIAARAQVDPYARNLIQLGVDVPLTGKGPQGVYAYYHYNDPGFSGTNVALRLAVAPAYVDGEFGFKGVLTRNTDVGLGFNGGAFAENYYEVRGGSYLKQESFDGHGGGVSVSVYQLLNPGRLIPVSLVLRGGVTYSVFDATDDTDAAFQLPEDRANGYVRAGVRVAGKEPMLYPDLGLELSVWTESRWRLENGAYGYAGDRSVSDRTDLYWVYAGLDYAWTNTGHKLSFHVTAGGSENADRQSAWRIGGVLPLVAEFPLILPGYYYQELSARRFVHLSGSYSLPIDTKLRWQLRFEGAVAGIEAIPGMPQEDDWHSGVGVGLSFTSRDKAWRVIARSGYGFNAVRSGGVGAHSVGLLFQYDFEHGRRREARREPEPPAG